MKQLFIITLSILISGSSLAEGVKHGSKGGKGDGSGGGRSKPRAGEGRPMGNVSVTVPAKMKQPVDFLSALFTRQNNCAVNTSTDHSAEAAVTQDVIITNDQTLLESLRKSNQISQESTLFGDSLVLAVPLDNRAGVKTPQDLTWAQVTKIFIPDPEKFPEGVRAKQALQKLKIWEIVASKVKATDNIESSLSDLTKGGAQAGIFFLVDTKGKKGLQTTFSFPADSYTPFEYPMVLTRKGDTNSMARAYFQLLNTHFADKAFMSSGFASKYKQIKAKKPEAIQFPLPGHRRAKEEKESPPEQAKIP